MVVGLVDGLARWDLLAPAGRSSYLLPQARAGSIWRSSPFDPSYLAIPSINPLMIPGYQPAGVALHHPL